MRALARETAECLSRGAIKGLLLQLLIVAIYWKVGASPLDRYGDEHYRLDRFNDSEYTLTRIEPLSEFSSQVDVSSTSLTATALSRSSFVADVLNISSKYVRLSDRAQLRVNFTCSSTVDSKRCEKARNAFTYVTDMLSGILVLKADVLVSTTFGSFCNGGVNGTVCTNSVYLGSANPTSFFKGSLLRSGYSPILSASDVGNLSTTDLLYPQALVKQFNVNDRIRFSDTDIVAEFNSDFDFWFPGDGAIAEQQYDFTYVVLHELVHGLGITTGWRNHLYSLGMSNALTPPIVRSNSSAAGISFQPPFVFDAYIVDAKNNKIAMDALDFVRYQDFNSKSKEQWLNNFLRSSQGASSISAYELATKKEGSLYFQLPATAASSADKLTLYTIAGTYQSKSTLSHLGLAAFNNTSDFLMRPMLISNKTLSLLTEQFCGQWVFGPVGPKLVKMLQTIGYTLISDLPSGLNSSTTSASSLDLGSFKFGGSQASSSTKIFPQATAIAIVVLLLLAL